MNLYEEVAKTVATQGTQEWHDIRLGRFTSSEMYRLLTDAKRDMTDEELAARPKKGTGSRTTQVIDNAVLSDGAITYVEEKVAEVMTGQSQMDVYALGKEYGKEWEPFAAEYFSQKFEIEIEEAPFVPFGQHAGGSPDRFLVGVSGGLEIKCPLKAKNHIKYLQLKDQFDLLEKFPQFYWQCMSNLLWTEREKWHFVSFCPAMINDKHKMKRIEINPVKAHFDLIGIKLEKAVEKKLQLLNLLQ